MKAVLKTRTGHHQVIVNIILCLVLAVLLAGPAVAQVAESDTLQRVNTSALNEKAADTAQIAQDTVQLSVQPVQQNDSLVAKAENAMPEGGDTPAYPQYFLYIFLGSLVILALIRILSPDDFSAFFASLFNLKFLLNQFREGKFGFNLPNLLFDLLSVAMLSIYIQLLFFSGQAHLFPWVAAFTCIGYFMKLIAIQFFANIFFGRGEAMVHLLFHMLLTRISGLLLLPVLFIALYQDFTSLQVFMAGIGAGLLSIYLLWLLRLYVQIKSVSTGSTFHLFLYLCTVELSPFIILLKGVIL